MLKYRVRAGRIVDRSGNGLFRKEPELDHFTTAISKLSETQKQLICDVVGSTTCDKKAFSDFSKLKSAVRELKLANAVSQKWARIDFVEDPSTIDTKKGYTPSFVAKLEEYQKAAATLVADCRLDAASIYDKKAVICDPAKLTDYQKLVISKVMLVKPEKISPKTINDFFESIRQLPDQERLHYWKNCVLSFVTVGDLVHKLRYESNPQLNFMEQRLVCAALGRDYSSFTQAELDSVKEQLVNKTTNNRFTDAVERLYFKIQSEGFAKSSDELWKVGQLHSEYETLLDFFGISVNSIKVSIDKTSASISSIGQEHEAEVGVCQDSGISLVLTPLRGKSIFLDCVFDGMGGHGGGDVASSIASRTFAFSAACSLISNPEEARRAAVLADYAVLFRSKSDSKLRSMGTTAAISFVSGNEFYGIHAGDSSYGVYRNGDLVFKSLEHSLAFEMIKLSYPGEKAAWDVATYQERIDYLLSDASKPILAQFGSNPTISSALGSNPSTFEINNGDSRPVLLKRGDKISTQSDGTETVSDEESGLIINRNDIFQAVQKIYDLAVARVNVKGDDKFLIVREIS